MIREIEIIDYGQDYGYGNVIAVWNDGIPSNGLVRKSFDSIPDALAWLMEITGEEGGTRALFPR